MILGSFWSLTSLQSEINLNEMYRAFKVSRGQHLKLSTYSKAYSLLTACVDTASRRRRYFVAAFSSSCFTLSGDAMLFAELSANLKQAVCEASGQSATLTNFSHGLRAHVKV